MKTYIYCIKNVLDNKVYIGSTKSLNRRKYQHFYHLRRDEHRNIHLQNSFNKNKEDKFYFFLLEECNSNNRIEKEIFWINNYKSNLPEFGYNIMEPKSQAFTHKQETLEKISKGVQGKSVKTEIDVYTTSLEFIKSFISINECARQMKFPSSVISDIVNKKKNRLSFKGYIFTKKGIKPNSIQSSRQRLAALSKSIPS